MIVIIEVNFIIYQNILLKNIMSRKTLAKKPLTFPKTS